MAFESEARSYSIARGSSATLWFTAAVVGLTLLLPVLLILIPLWPSKIELEVSRDGVRIVGSMYGRLITQPIAASAHLFSDLDKSTFSPAARTNGVGLPNYQGGWFRLEDGGKGLLFVTDWSRAVIVPTSEGFALLASPDDPQGFLSRLQEVEQAKATEADGTLGLVKFPLASPRASTGSLTSYVAIVSIAPLLIAALLGFLTWISRRVRFELDPQGLRIRGPYGRLIPRESIDLENARMVDLKNDSSYRRAIRTNGIGMPGFAAGWFRFKGGRSALLFVTDRTKVVSIPTHLGYEVLLSPAEPEAFLSDLQNN